MKIAIHQPQYLPWVGYFHKMASVDLFVVLDDVQFKKNEWQHRNRIRNAKGWQWISVPNHYRFPQRINEVAIDNTVAWQETHLKSLAACYAKAPYYNGYIDDFREFFDERHETIASLNISSVKLCASLTGITVPLEISSAYNFPGQSTERLVEICRHFKADSYLAGAGGHDYMDLDLFHKAGITVEFQKFTPVLYDQHWASFDNPFIAGLSIVDLLFNCGPESLRVLMGGT